MGNNLPLGQKPPLLVASGTAPPAVFLLGRPTLGSVRISIQITTGGVVGIALFAWAKDGGLFAIGSDQQPTSWTTGVLTAASVPLPGTGLSASFPATGPYSTDNLYAAATPVPEAVLRWLTDFVTVDLWDRRGRNPQDPAMVSAKERYDQAMAELKEASDSTEGLFDLPVSEDVDSAITTGGPLGYSEQSPYTWTIQEQAAAQSEDSNNGPPGVT